MKAGLQPLDVGAGHAARFRAYAGRGDEQAAATLLTAPALDLLHTTAATFDIEVLDSWLVLYGYGFDVSTTDPDRWAWVFSLTSRWLDQCAAWAASWPTADSAAGASGAAPAWRDVPFHTERTWPTPRQLVEPSPPLGQPRGRRPGSVGQQQRRRSPRLSDGAVPLQE